MSLAVSLAVSLLLASATSAAALSVNADNGPWMTNGQVFASAQYGNVLFIGGTFTRISALPPGSPGNTSITVANLAAIDMTTGAGIAAFHPSVTGDGGQTADVESLAVVGNTLYVGGQFSAVDGSAHYNIAAIDIDPGTFAGTVDAGFNGTVGVPGAANEGTFYTYAILPGTDGLFVGGVFAKVDGVTRTNAAELNWDGTLVSSWSLSGLSGAVRDMEMSNDGGSIFVAGGFSAPAQSIVRVGVATGALSTWAIPPGGVIVGDSSNPGMTCWSLAVAATRLYAGCGRGPNYVAAFKLNNGDSGDRVWQYKTTGNVQSVALAAGGQLVFGGHFGTFLKDKVCGGKKLLKNLGILTAIGKNTPSLNCKFRPNFEGPNPFGGVWEIQVTPTYLWAGGAFLSVAGVTHQGLARFTF